MTTENEDVFWVSLATHDRVLAENERLRAAMSDILESRDARWGYSDSVTTIARAALNNTTS